MGFIFKKEKFGKFGGKKFQNFNSEKLHFLGFSERFLPTKTIRQNWSGSSWVKGGDHTHSSLFSLKSEKKN